MQTLFLLQINGKAKNRGWEETELGLTNEQARNVSETINQSLSTKMAEMCFRREKKISNKAESVNLWEFCFVLGFNSACCKGCIASEATNEFSVHSFEAGI